MNTKLIVGLLAALVAASPLAIAQDQPGQQQPTPDPTPDPTPAPNQGNDGFVGSTTMWLLLGLVALVLVVALIFALAGGRDRTERIERVVERDRSVGPP